MNSWRTSQTLPSMFTLLVTSGLVDVTTAVVAGISSSMAPSAALLVPLKVCSTWEPAGATILTVTAILKVTAITSTRGRCEWDSGLGSASMAIVLLTRIPAGNQCPGFSLKRCQKLSSKYVTRDVISWTSRKNISTVLIEKTLLWCVSKRFYQQIWDFDGSWEINKSLGKLQKYFLFQWLSGILIINLRISSIA